MDKDKIIRKLNSVERLFRFPILTTKKGVKEIKHYVGTDYKVHTVYQYDGKEYSETDLFLAGLSEYRSETIDYKCMFIDINNINYIL